MQNKNIIITILSIIILFLFGALAFQSGYKNGACNQGEGIFSTAPSKTTLQKDLSLEQTKTENYDQAEFLGMSEENNLVVRSEMGHVKEITLDNNIQYKDKDNKVVTLEEFKNLLNQSQEIPKNEERSNQNNLIPIAQRLNIAFKTSSVAKGDKIESSQIDSIGIISN